MFTSTLLLSVLPVALAQYGSSGSSSTTASVPTSTASATPGIATIAVGQTALAFSPNSITAAVGSIVEFQFYPQKHSVAQAAFATPCEPLANGTGFFSGGMQTASGTNANVFTITVNDTKPIWFYCAAPGHCGQGMVGVINPPTDGAKTIEKFVAAAKEVNATVAPSAVQGGTVGPASAVKAPKTTATGSAGVEARGNIQWGLLGLTGAMAAGVGGLLI